jgi:hypothetical protein
MELPMPDQQETLTDEQIQAKPHLHYWSHHFTREIQALKLRIEVLEKIIGEKTDG